MSTKGGSCQLPGCVHLGYWLGSRGAALVVAVPVVLATGSLSSAFASVGAAWPFGNDVGNGSIVTMVLSCIAELFLGDSD